MLQLPHLNVKFQGGHCYACRCNWILKSAIFRSQRPSIKVGFAHPTYRSRFVWFRFELYEFLHFIDFIVLVSVVSSHLDIRCIACCGSCFGLWSCCPLHSLVPAGFQRSSCIRERIAMALCLAQHHDIYGN